MPRTWPRHFLCSRTSVDAVKSGLWTRNGGGLEKRHDVIMAWQPDHCEIYYYYSSSLHPLVFLNDVLTCGVWGPRGTQLGVSNDCNFGLQPTSSSIKCRREKKIEGWISKAKKGWKETEEHAKKGHPKAQKRPKMQPDSHANLWPFLEEAAFICLFLGNNSRHLFIYLYETNSRHLNFLYKKRFWWGRLEIPILLLLFPKTNKRKREMRECAA